MTAAASGTHSVEPKLSHARDARDDAIEICESEQSAERRRDADRDENELASRIQALGADRSRLADELDGSLVKTRRLERTNQIGRASCRERAV